jgi:hypothetical protein
MRSLAIFVVILLIILGAVALFLVATTPRQSTPLRIAPSLIQQIPASAESFAIIPTAAALDAKLHANPITRVALEKWRANQPLPQPWMIGGADLVAWKNGGTTRYFLHLDSFRAMVVRMFGHGSMVTLPAEQPLDSASVAEIADLAARLPPGDALVVQRESARGAYPPIGRPAVTSVSVTPTEIRLTSVAAGFSPPEGGLKAAPTPHFPRSAMLSAAFSSPPRLLRDLDRIFGAKISDIFTDGGLVCVYDVDLRKLLPRPLGVIAVPDDRKRRATVDSLGNFVRTGAKDGMLLLSFDHSIEQYQKDVFDQPTSVGNQWTMRIDPPRLVPVLNDLGQNLGLRIAAPRLFRSARDLDQWISGLEQAKVIEASDSADSGAETLQVQIAAK